MGKKTGIRRKIASNIKYSEALEKKWEGYIIYWTDLDVVCKMRDVDLIWDEIATELDSRNWVNLTAETKRFLSQYRKRGVDIYANTQDFSLIDARARLMVTRVKTMKKVMGSRDISTTKPNPKYIWGVIMIKDLINYRTMTTPETRKYEVIPDFLFIERSLVETYDTRQDIPVGEKPRLHHEVVYCEYHGKGEDETNGIHCNFCQVRHI